MCPTGDHSRRHPSLRGHPEMSEAFVGLEHVLGAVLAFFFDLVPVFGVAIILMTVTVNLLLFPLTLKQARSTRAFQRVQPEIKRIQAEYADDRARLQEELARAQRDAGATPAGCLLPMLIQTPIWLALYRVFRNVAVIAHGGADVQPLIPTDSSLLDSVRAGQTHFLGMGLGNTISEGFSGGMPAALPYVALLVFMVAAQYTQQWYALRSANPSGERTRTGLASPQIITRAMPVFLGFISLRLPSGLVLYWATSNIVRLGLQRLIHRIDPILPADASTQQPARSHIVAPAQRSHPVSKKKQRHRRRRR